MINVDQCPDGLLYNSFSIILLQTFTTESLCKNIEDSKLISEFKSSHKSIDKQIFTNNENIIKRYTLPSFETEITIEAPKDDNDPTPARKTVLWGTVKVWAAIFFDNTVQISYRFVVDAKEQKSSPCHTSQPLNSDEIIALSAILQCAEHWSATKDEIQEQEQEKKQDEKQEKKQRFQQEIQQTVTSIKIFNMALGYKRYHCSSAKESPKDIFNRISTLYRNLIDDTPENNKRLEAHHYTLIDVWEDFDHEPNESVDFSNMSEAEIIEHIEIHHKPELIGIMSLYPYEWPYRAESSFKDICGGNIAIDTDDLVLANPNVCIIFGTYGKRGDESGTNWQEHLDIRESYCTSWPEYLVLVQLLLVKKQTLRYVLERYTDASKVARSNSIRTLINQIEQNAMTSIEMTNMLLRLNATRYLRFISHKHMYNMTEQNMRIVDDEKHLQETISSIDNALINTSNIIEARQSDTTKNILFFITIASLFSVLMENDNIPVLSLVLPNTSIGITAVLEIITFFAIIYGCYKLYKSSKQE